MSNYGITLDEAFKALSVDDDHRDLINEAKKPRLGYKGFDDLFDQVYCTLTHGGDLGTNRKILGDLGRVDIKYEDDQVSIDYSKPGSVRIGIVDTEDNLNNAIKIAEIYGLDYEIYKFGPTLHKIYITVPEDEPVDKSVFNYVDANNELMTFTSDKTKAAAERRTKREPILASAESEVKDLEQITEDVASSMPVTPLSESEILSFVDDLPEATSSRPPQAFKLGYIRELKSEIASKYRGGRGSDEQPMIRIFKASEYSRLYTKAPYENLASTKAFRKETGKEAGHERTGFHSTDTENGDILNAIGSYPNGDRALQAYHFKDNKVKVAYFISIDDADLTPAAKEDIAPYLTPAAANKLLNHTADDSSPATSADNVNRFKLTGIYMLGNLGHSII